eukprot:9769632-Alexandrium_andersonii.AAC.1
MSECIGQLFRRPRVQPLAGNARVAPGPWWIAVRSVAGRLRWGRRDNHITYTGKHAIRYPGLYVTGVRHGSNNDA